MTKPIIQEGDKIIFKKDFDKVDTNVTGFTDDQKEYEGKEAIVEEVTFTIEGDMSGHPFFCELVDEVASRENPINSDINEQLLKDNEGLSKQLKEANRHIEKLTKQLKENDGYIEELEIENQELKINKIDLEIDSEKEKENKVNDIFKKQVTELESTVKQLARLLSK